MKEFALTNLFGQTEICTLSVSKYSNNGHVAVQIWCEDGPYSTLTVNVNGIKKFPENCSALDVNNFPNGTGLVKRLGIAKPTGKYLGSGFCSYPVYEFDMDKLRKYTETEKKEPKRYVKTRKGTRIARSKFGVGKIMCYCVYVHRQYADKVVPPEILSHAESVLKEKYPDHHYNCIKYDLNTRVVSFQESPDFDTAREPIVGDYVAVAPDGKTRKGHSDYIFHHKWLWVEDDYEGFDVESSFQWSQTWLSVLTETADGNGIERWHSQLKRFGLE